VGENPPAETKVQAQVDLTVPEPRYENPWSRLRETSQRIKEAIPNLSPVDQLSLCTSTFLEWARVAEKKIPNMTLIGDEFEEDFTRPLARAIEQNGIAVAEIPGTDQTAVITRGRRANSHGEKQATWNPRLDYALKSINWLETLGGNQHTDRVLRASFFWVLAASFGIDPGPQADAIDPEDIASRIMRGEFSEYSKSGKEPPPPFIKSPLREDELLAPTAIEDLFIVLSQNAVVSLGFRSKAVSGLVEESNQRLQEQDFGDLTGSRLNLARSKFLKRLFTNKPQQS